jgi:hypothetical protein
MAYVKDENEELSGWFNVVSSTSRIGQRGFCGSPYLIKIELLIPHIILPFNTSMESMCYASL